MATAALNKQIGQFFYDGDLHSRTVDGAEYIIGVSTAYNAHGLIGPEVNGIFILNETQRRVVLDRHMQADTGYFGSTEKQRKEFERIKGLNDDMFMSFIRTNPRFRGEHTLSA